MTVCLLCQSSSPYPFSLSFLFSLKPFPAFFTCPSCLSKLEVLKEQTTCKGCRRIQTIPSYCKDCTRWIDMYPERTIYHHALYGYNQILRDWLERFKFQGDVRMAAAFEKEISQELVPLIKKGFLLVPVPISPGRRKERGFNQTEELLRAAGLPYVLLLEKREMDSHQSEKNRKERMETTQPFYLNSEMVKMTGKKLCLVDDVYTTGRTVYHAMDALESLHPAEICSFSIAR